MILIYQIPRMIITAETQSHHRKKDNRHRNNKTQHPPSDPSAIHQIPIQFMFLEKPQTQAPQNVWRQNKQSDKNQNNHIKKGMVVQ